CFEAAIGNYQAFAMLFRAFECDSPCRPAGAEQQHTQIPKIDGELFANCARKPLSVGIESAELFVLDLDGVDCADALCICINVIDQLHRGDFVRYSQIKADKFL